MGCVDENVWGGETIPHIFMKSFDTIFIGNAEMRGVLIYFKRKIRYTLGK